MTRGQVGTFCATRSANTPDTGVSALPGGPFVIRTPLTHQPFPRGRAQEAPQRNRDCHQNRHLGQGSAWSEGCSHTPGLLPVLPDLLVGTL